MEKTLQILKISVAKFYRYRLRVIAVALAATIGLCIFHYYFNNRVSSATMSLNYSEASAGLNPNSTRFNISELISEGVMSRVLEAAGIEDKVTWDELAACIGTSSVDSKGKSSGGYISTSYYISYDHSKLKNPPEHMPNADDMVKLICSTYKSYFLENYGDNKSILNYKPLVDVDGEPYISLSSLEIKLNQIKRYIDMRMKENKSYTDTETGANFNSLLKDVENLSDYDFTNIYSFILETGVSRDRATLVALESYKSRLDALSYDKYMEFYDSDNYGIKLYDEAMSAIVMIPSVDEMNEYYMSRTKTAADAMATNADSELKEATSYKKIIANTDYLLSQLNKSSSNPHRNLLTAAQMITDLNDSINRISEELKLLDISYIKHKTQNYLVFDYSEQSFSQKISGKRTLVEVAAVVFMCYLYLVFTTVQEQRRNKKNAKV